VEKGRLIEFRLQGERRLGVVERPEGKKNWVAIDESGQSRILAPKQITYVVEGSAYKSSEISQFVEEVRPYLDPSSLEVAWEILADDGTTVNANEMAVLLFGERNPSQCYAAYYLLSEDKIYFKNKGDRYEPRSNAQVAEIRHQLEVERSRQQEWDDFFARVRQSLEGESVQWNERDRLRMEALERFATFGEEATHRTPALELLAALERPETPASAFALLQDLNLWSPHENLFLRRTQIPTHFSTKVLEVAQCCLNSPPPDSEPHRLDLTHLKVYTIDDASTVEIDDGLSLEYLEGAEHQLWIHIADPTRWLSPGDELDLEARRRCTTVYLPTGMIPMLPEELATGPMSLNQGQLCCALSFRVILDKTGRVREYSIHPSWVKPTYRLTYDDVDEMLHLGIEAESEIAELARWARQRRNWRQSQGSIFINMPEASIKVKNDEVTIEVLDDSISRYLVAEMMILAGEIAADYGQRHNLPIPYRHQPEPELPSEEELLQLPPGPVQACAIRKCMPRSEMSLTPYRHASLGLATYTQVTSPIRRYSDLLTHFQIKAHLRGEPLPFSADEMQHMMMSIGSVVKEATLVERQTSRYWGIEYLRRHSDRSWQALVLRWIREDENLGSLLLEDLGIEFVWRFPRPVQLGERLILRVAYADPREDAIQFQELTGVAIADL
jgi:exoribonuclease II